MANLNQENIDIRVKIREETEKGQFNSALYYTVDEFEALTEKQLTDAKKDRVDAWVAHVTTESAKIPDVPTEEELNEEKARLEEEIAEIDKQKLELTDKQHGELQHKNRKNDNLQSVQDWILCCAMGDEAKKGKNVLFERVFL